MNTTNTNAMDVSDFVFFDQKYEDYFFNYFSNFFIFHNLLYSIVLYTVVIMYIIFLLFDIVFFQQFLDVEKIEKFLVLYLLQYLVPRTRENFRTYISLIYIIYTISYWIFNI